METCVEIYLNMVVSDDELFRQRRNMETSKFPFIRLLLNVFRR